MSNVHTEHLSQTRQRVSGPVMALALTCGIMTGAAMAESGIPESRDLRPGEWLDEQGVSLRGSGSWYSFYNTYGVEPYHTQNSLSLLFSLDLDLEKLISLPGGSLHIKEGITPAVTNVNYGPMLGDVYGAVSPFIPRKNRLIQFSYRQKLLEDQFQFDIGRTNPATAFMQPACSFLFTCFNPLILMNGQVYAYPFAYWSAAARYNLDNYYMQAGGWILNREIPFESGWHWRKEKHNGHFYLAQVGHATQFGESAYPSRLEMTYYRSEKKHPNPSRQSEKSFADGLLLNGTATLYREDGGADLQDKNPRSLQLEGGISSSFEPGVSGGNDKFGFIGVNARNFIPGRPDDQFGVRYSLFRVTRDYQAFLQEAGQLSGSPYTTGRSTHVFEVNAHFAVTPSISIDPFINYVYHPSRYQNAFGEQQGRSGFLFGLGINFALDPLLGWRH